MYGKPSPPRVIAYKEEDDEESVLERRIRHGHDKQKQADLDKMDSILEKNQAEQDREEMFENLMDADNQADAAEEARRVAESIEAQMAADKAAMAQAQAFEREQQENAFAEAERLRTGKRTKRHKRKHKKDKAAKTKVSILRQFMSGRLGKKKKDQAAAGDVSNLRRFMAAKHKNEVWRERTIKRRSAEVQRVADVDAEVRPREPRSDMELRLAMVAVLVDPTGPTMLSQEMADEVAAVMMAKLVPEVLERLLVHPDRLARLVENMTERIQRRKRRKRQKSKSTRDGAGTAAAAPAKNKRRRKKGAAKRKRTGKKKTGGDGAAAAAPTEGNKRRRKKRAVKRKRTGKKKTGGDGAAAAAPR